MTIKISQLGAVANLQGNTIIPMVSNLTGTLTTVQANMTQISNFITGGSSGGYGNIVPSANLTYSLGSPTQWWKDIYVSSNTIYVGGTALSVSDGTLSLDGYAVAGKDAATTPVGTAAGLNWHYANAGIVTDQLRTSAYGAGKFVAWLIGTTSSPNYYPNLALYSSDGITWNQTTTPNVAQTSQQITFGGDKFVAIYTTTGNTATSTDGINWTFNQDVIPAYGVYGYEWYKNLVAYGNGRFVALTGYTTQRSVISTDGVTWSNGSIYTGSVTDLPAIDRQGQSLLYQSLAFTSGVFVASATRVNGTGGNLIAYTTDGVTWGNIQLPWGHDLTSGYILGAGGGAFVGVPAASGNVGIRSTDGGRTWSNISLPEPFTYSSVLYGNGQFILLSADTNTNIAISSDGGVTWSEVATPSNQYYSGAYGDNTFIATGIGTGNVFNISYSTAGVDATPIGATTPSTARFTNATITTDLVVSGDITGPTITDLYANVIAANTGMKGYVDSVSGSESIANVNMKGYVDGQVTAANSAIVTANVGMIGYVGSQVTAANTSANTANIAMVGYVNNQVTTVVTTANVGMKGYVDNAVNQVGGSSYGNANVAQFLPTYSGNIGQLLTTDDLVVFGTITAGFALPTITFANVILNAIGLANSYAQLNIQNLDSVGTQNSADFIATAPNGTDTTHYIDMGINGNNWSSGSWTISGANDGYVYINQGNLTLGTDTADTTVKVHVGGTLAANVVSTFGSNGLSVAGNVTGTYFIGDGSQLTNLPGGGSYSNVQVATYLPTYSGDIANITLGASGEIAFNQSSYIIETDIVDGNLTPTGYHSLSLNSTPNGILVLNALDSNSAVSSNLTVANTSAQINVNNQIWTFGNDGNLTLPDTASVSINYANGSPVSFSGDYSNVNVQAFANLSNYAYNANVTAANLGMKGYVDSVLGGGSSYGNSNVASYLISTQVSVANILLAPSGNIVFADGTVQTTAGGGNYSNVQVATYLPTYSGVVTASNVAVNGNVTAQYLFGNGSQLTGIVASGGNYGNIDVKAFLETDAGPGDGFQRVIEGYYANLILGDTTKLFSFGNSSKSYFGHDGFANININYVRADNSDVRIATNNGAYAWIFDNAGNLTLSGNTFSVNYANGTPVTFSSSSYGNINVQAYTETMGFQNFGNVNVAAYVTTANSAVIGYVDNAVSTANVGIIGYIDRGNTIVTAGITTANVGMKGYVDNLGLDNLSDVVISSPTVGDVLYYNGTNWVKQNGPTIRWSLSASGTSDYVFTGPGFYASTNDPLLYLHRGTTYIFVNTVHGSHPLEIRVSDGGAAYANGVSGAGTATITFTVPMDAPSTLYYQCTVHSIMGNTINVVT